MSQIPDHLKYAETHEWAKLEGDNVVRVGITDFAQQELGDLVFVELPDVGASFDTGQACAVVESVKTASDINTPVTGKIVEINGSLPEAPELINENPYDAWIFCVKADNPAELDSLLDPGGYRDFIKD